MAKSKSNEVVIYLGPTIKNVVATGTVFNNGLTKAVVEAIDKCPAVDELIVPVVKVDERGREALSLFLIQIRRKTKCHTITV